MNELKEFMKEGGAKVFTQYAVEIGDSLWNSLWSYVETKYPGEPNSYCSIYRIEGVYEDAGQKFAILQNRQDQKYYRMDFSLTDVEGFVPSDALTEVTKSYAPAAEPQFALADVEAFETDYASKKKAEEEDKTNKSNGQNPDNKSEGDDNKKNPETGTPLISLIKATMARMMMMIKRKIILLRTLLNILNLKLSMMNYRLNSRLLKLRIIA